MPVKNVENPNKGRTPKTELVAFKCRKSGRGKECPGMQAEMTNWGKGVIHYKCTICTNVVSVSQGHGSGSLGGLF